MRGKGRRWRLRGMERNGRDDRRKERKIGG